MIKEIQRESEISGVNSPLLTRIFIGFKYKTGSDNAWKQINENNDTVALLASVEGNFTLALTEKANLEEIKEFICFVGYNSVVSDLPLKENTENEFSLFKFNGNGPVKALGEFSTLDGNSAVNDYKRYHELIFFDEKCDFENWYYDFSKKIVKNDAKAVALKNREELISVATAPAIFKDTAIISGVFTKERFRKNGCAAATIYELIAELQKLGVTEYFLWCEKILEKFYNKIGFQKVGSIYMETEL